MASRVEVVRNYTVSIASRMLGRGAWQEAMSEEPLRTYIDRGNIPTWAKNLNIALDHAAPVYAALEILAPISSRIFVPAIKSENQERYNTLLTAISVSLLPLAADIAVWASLIYSGHNFMEIVDLKFAANTATHVGLDIVSAAARRARTFRPSATTLAV